MFSNLLQHYFRPASETSGVDDLSSTLEAMESRIVVLQMIGLNFRDAIQVKPLFEQLDREIQALDRGSPEEREVIASTRRLLRNAAEKIVVDQVKQIESASNGITCSVKLELGEVSVPECLSYVGITLEAVSKNRDFISLSVRDQTQESAEPVEFDVSYFDMPMVDYTRMSDPPTTYSITLRDIPEVGSPRIFVAVLPTRSYRGSEAYRFEELLGEFIDPELTQ
jgi:hypothetical protein